MDYPLLKNAPIVEAIFQIKFELPKNIQLLDLKNYHDLVKEEFPTILERNSFKGTFNLEASGIDEKSLSSKTNLDAYYFSNQEKTKSITIKLDSFTFSNFENYKGWDNFISEVMKYCSSFTEKYKPISIKRIAVRFINEIKLKTPVEYEKYFYIPKYGHNDSLGTIDYDLFNYFSQSSYVNNEINAKANLTLGVRNNKEDEDSINFIIDIDVYKEISEDIENINEHLEDLRSFKNELFFKMLTEKTIKLLK